MLYLLTYHLGTFDNIEKRGKVPAALKTSIAEQADGPLRWQLILFVQVPAEVMAITGICNVMFPMSVCQSVSPVEECVGQDNE